ncbi:hypothetical protein [Leptospira santarosai]|uniref:hypothetical protein n=1 Tax=Leptospira santarosai TaxID=28183 RepID=UPI0002BE6454|nr:hypothetical protein [Leptospira santarosai]EMO20745.1 hypothetical protein LEP1GSC168_0078 [Leptospira santarosai str. HAI134]MDI7183615.1 hypothetical protein [Leptospira santarosai]
MSNVFTLDNTQGFSQDDLNKMNAEFETRIAEYSEDVKLDTFKWDSICKNLADRILEKY